MASPDPRVKSHREEKVDGHRKGKRDTDLVLLDLCYLTGARLSSPNQVPRSGVRS